MSGRSETFRGRTEESNEPFGSGRSERRTYFHTGRQNPFLNRNTSSRDFYQTSRHVTPNGHDHGYRYGTGSRSQSQEVDSEQKHFERKKRLRAPLRSHEKSFDKNVENSKDLSTRDLLMFYFDKDAIDTLENQFYIKEESIHPLAFDLHKFLKHPISTNIFKIESKTEDMAERAGNESVLSDDEGSCRLDGKEKPKTVTPIELSGAGPLKDSMLKYMHCVCLSDHSSAFFPFMYWNVYEAQIFSSTRKEIVLSHVVAFYFYNYLKGGGMFLEVSRFKEPLDPLLDVSVNLWNLSQMDCIFVYLYIFLDILEYIDYHQTETRNLDYLPALIHKAKVILFSIVFRSPIIPSPLPAHTHSLFFFPHDDDLPERMIDNSQAKKIYFQKKVRNRARA